MSASAKPVAAVLIEASPECLVTPDGRQLVVSGHGLLPAWDVQQAVRRRQSRAVWAPVDCGWATPPQVLASPRTPLGSAARAGVVIDLDTR